MVTLERSGPADCFLERFIDTFLRQALCVLSLARQNRRQCSQLSTWSLAGPL